jgi:hypothetical protein
LETLSSFLEGACEDQPSPSSSGDTLAAANTSHAASSTAASASIHASASAQTCSLALTYSASVAESHLSESSRAFLDEDCKDDAVDEAEWGLEEVDEIDMLRDRETMSVMSLLTFAFAFTIAVVELLFFFLSVGPVAKILVEVALTRG